MVIVKTEWLVTEPSGDSQNLKADGQVNTDDGDEGPWREVDGAQCRQVCGGLTGCRGNKGDDTCYS